MKIRRILAITVLILMTVPVILSWLNFSRQKMEAANRDHPGDGVILLPEAVPLSDVGDASICMQAFNMINTYRQANGLKPLLWNRDLEDCAYIRAQEACTTWSHTRPNGQPWYTVRPDIMFGENLARGYYDAGSLVAAWQASPTHNENLLYPNFRYAAIKCVNGCYALEFA